MESTSLITAEMVGKISTSLTDLATNVLNIFIDLLPVMAVVAGVAFGIRFVRGLFNKTSKGR